MIRLEMRNYNMISTERSLKNNSFIIGKIDKYEYLTGVEILPSDRRRVIEQAKFTYSPLEKVLGKKRLKINKEVEAIEQHEKQLVKSTAFSEKEKSIPTYKQKEILLACYGKNWRNWNIT